MGRKDASTARTPVDQYRKQIASRIVFISTCGKFSKQDLERGHNSAATEATLPSKKWQKLRKKDGRKGRDERKTRL
ncbi:triple QxxK/R motif-containing protein isoform X2 [Rissa tridactyla]|uniref:triple QxxK/R motif-containing protein isoform X2 n=1 Tax=Rissa tridactyla TaxID=75485 RepID=UPI0023BAC4C7|nr:triple QxxK/R motif-containing protein isoform X2 [Rissa tridactyla]